MKKYIEIMKYSLKKNTTFIVNYFFNIISFFVHILVFNALWDYIIKDGSLVGYTREELIVYIILTEFVIYSSNRCYKEIATTIKNGDVAVMLSKPINYVLYILAEQSTAIIRIAVNIIVSIAMIIMLGNGIQFSMLGITLCTVSLVFSVILNILLEVIIGLSAFSMEENRSIALLIQKMQFLLVFVPIEFYGGIFQKILSFLPTTYIVYPPGKLLVHPDLNLGIKLITMQGIVLVLSTVIIAIMYKKGVEKINANGG
ncbi:MAG: ABC-2 family transporter protein [Clostridia bacterium]|nr:ABC-2 family transporter protein [Clostridia bacterium]